MATRATSTKTIPPASERTTTGGDNFSHVHQSQNQDESGNATIQNQNTGPQIRCLVAQRQSGPNGTTSQRQLTDPRCCGDSQVGGEQNREDIHQATTQSASETDAVQTSTLHGEAHQVSGEELTFAATPATSPDNRCRIEHDGRNNSGGDHFSSEGQGSECMDLFRDTTCTSGPSEDIAIAQDETPPCESFGSGDLESFLMPATFGNDIPMPDYSSEPADYVDPGGWW